MAKPTARQRLIVGRFHANGNLRRKDTRGFSGRVPLLLEAVLLGKIWFDVNLMDFKQEHRSDRSAIQAKYTYIEEDG